MTGIFGRWHADSNWQQSIPARSIVVDRRSNSLSRKHQLGLRIPSRQSRSKRLYKVWTTTSWLLKLVNSWSTSSRSGMRVRWLHRYTIGKSISSAAVAVRRDGESLVVRNDDIMIPNHRSRMIHSWTHVDNSSALSDKRTSSYSWMKWRELTSLFDCLYASGDLSMFHLLPSFVISSSCQVCF
jgi:hypothetical protein